MSETDALITALMERHGDDKLVCDACDIIIGQRSAITKLKARTPAPDGVREAVAQALFDRFLERGKLRMGGASFRDGTRVCDLPASYKDDFYKDADAALAALSKPAGEE